MAAPKNNKNAVGNNGGRPPKFKKEFVKQLIDFFDVEPYKKEIMEKTTEYHANGKIKRKSEKYDLVPNKLPSLYTFAKHIGVNYVTIRRWAEKGDQVQSEDESEQEEAIIEFCNAYKTAKEAQKQFLIDLGLSGAAPATAYIFTAKNVTDMRDRTEITGADGDPMKTEVTVLTAIDKIYGKPGSN
jgi:hypothetical protein